MITLRTLVEVSADRQVMLHLPPETPTGNADFTVTVTPHRDSVGLPGELRKYFGTVRGDDARAADNDAIDADLADVPLTKFR